MTSERLRLYLLGIIAGALVLLNIQFYATFRMSRTVYTDASVSGSVEVTNLPQPGQGPADGIPP